VKIDDQRQRTAWMPVREILEEVIPLLPADELVGVRRLLLLDADYWRAKKPALARYVPIRGTHGADIELYFDSYETVPQDMRENRPFWAAALIATLGHELYHHRLRGQRRRRRPSYDREQEAADRWGEAQARDIVLRLYPRDRYQADYEAWHSLHEDCEVCSKRCGRTTSDETRS
jgi:hypothetical protein